MLTSMEDGMDDLPFGYLSGSPRSDRRSQGPICIGRGNVQMLDTANSPEKRTNRKVSIRILSVSTGRLSSRRQCRWRRRRADGGEHWDHFVQASATEHADNVPLGPRGRSRNCDDQLDRQPRRLGRLGDDRLDQGSDRQLHRRPLLRRGAACALRRAHADPRRNGAQRSECFGWDCRSATANHPNTRALRGPRLRLAAAVSFSSRRNKCLPPK